MGKKSFEPLYNKIVTGIAKVDNRKQFIRGVTKYVDRNNAKLTTQGPSERTIFSEFDREVLYDAAEMTAKEIREEVKKIASVGAEWSLMNKPFTPASILAIRYWTIKKDKEAATMALIYYMLSIYPTVHYNFFKFAPDENIMNYTINNMSNKFKIKQSKNIYEALVTTTVGSYEYHKDRIIRGEDADIIKFAMDVKTRINSLMRNVANEFYKNHEKGLYMNLDSNNFEPDSYHEADSNIFEVQRVTDKVTLKMLTNGPNAANVTLAANWCKVSVSELRNYITQLIVSENREDIHDLIESIMYLYLYDGQHKADDVRDQQFLVYTLEVYKKSNTNDKNIIKIKAILDKWLEDVGAYKKTQRVATLNDFRRSIFIFFVITIMKYS